MYKILRYLLFILPPEISHSIALQLLKFAYIIGFTRILFPKQKTIPTTIFGLKFKNPVGIGAGLDKNGDYIDCLAALNVGFIEVGAITPKPQPGNPKPRLFRLIKDKALINRFGFNNKGVNYLVENLKNRKTDCIVGVNLGKNKNTPLSSAKNDYIICLQQVYNYSDFLTINISSPNTPDLRKLQTQEYLEDLLQSIKSERDICSKTHQKYVPLLVKIAPDLNDEDLTIIMTTINKVGLDGIIATNTTNSRDFNLQSPFAKEQGGLSGAPITSLSTLMLQKIYQHNNQIPIISIGGINSITEAKKRFKHSASLIQLYTGLIYEGPGLVNKIVRSLKKEKSN